jgi:hypothetical protein
MEEMDTEMLETDEQKAGEENSSITSFINSSACATIAVSLQSWHSQLT